MIPSRRFFAASALDVAPLLLGARLTTRSSEGPVTVRLTETEAYLGRGTGPVPDPGSHARMGPTRRNRSMYGPPGHLYVYLSYGIHSAVNVVCSPDGTASAVLLRAGEVVAGRDLARGRRPAARRDVDLARGPGRLAAALGLDHGRDDGVDALGGRVVIELAAPAGDDAAPAREIRRGVRVGVSGPGGGPAYPWRFWLAGDPTVSAYRPGRTRAARTRITVR